MTYGRICVLAIGKRSFTVYVDTEDKQALLENHFTHLYCFVRIEKAILGIMIFVKRH